MYSKGTMKALSIQQPWAAAIIYGGKDIENRSWNTKYRGRFYVHSSLGFAKNAPQEVWDIFDKHFPDGSEAYGGIIGTVELVDCVNSSDSKWWQGPKGFVLKNPEPCAFKRAKGRLGFYEVPRDL